MKHDYINTGILRLTDFQVPPPERRRAGRVIMIECVQNIPCNPCSTICPQGAITIEGDITNIPVVDFSKCNGCGLCVANCPGLAIFMVDESIGDNSAEVGIPYEFSPFPEKGEIVSVYDRSGKIICDGEIVRVRNPKSYNKTAVIYFRVPIQFSLDARFIKRKADKAKTPIH
ncbi:4Fe-4S binding protein [candidate division KSB1 bacterium]|nr:4Fe-4S binding protein [candidate division KSB1 bacterium]